MARVELYKQGSLRLSASRTDDGAIELYGQDLARGDEYEYWLRIESADHELLARALHGRPDGDLLAGLRANRLELLVVGEERWLEAAGIAYSFDSYGQPNVVAPLGRRWTREPEAPPEFVLRWNMDSGRRIALYATRPGSPLRGVYRFASGGWQPATFAELDRAIIDPDEYDALTVGSLEELATWDAAAARIPLPSEASDNPSDSHS